MTNTTNESWKPLRREDLRLVTGQGRFVADLPTANALEAAILRSPFGHARIVDIDASAALEMPGVHAVLTGSDVAQFTSPLPSVVPDAPEYRCCAIDRARYVGEPVAVVVADDRYVAEDALELIDVEYEQLPCVVNPDDAVTAGAPTLHDSHPGNVAWRRGYRFGDPDDAFARADLVVQRDFYFPSFSSIPLETYGMICSYEPIRDEYKAEVNFQGPFTLHSVAARALNIPGDRLRIIVPQDVGGSFGTKAMVYPYVVLLCAAARAAGRPVRWIEDRLEHLQASSRASDRSCRAELALTRDGSILGFRTSLRENVGAYLRAPEPATVVRILSNLQGAYRMAGLEVDAAAVLTNRVPTGLNRGYGGPQHYFGLERLIDEAAVELGIDPADLRLRNLIQSDEFPYQSLSGGIYDSGAYSDVVMRALELADYRTRRAERGGRSGNLTGIGMAAVVDGSTSNMGYISLALEPEKRQGDRYLPKSGSLETARIKMDANGRISVSLHTAGCGQSHETVAAMLVAKELGVPADEVHVEDHMDTAVSAWSIASGSYSSRFAAMGASAVQQASLKLKEKLVRIAAHLLEANREDLILKDGTVAVRGVPTLTVSLKRLAGTAHWNPEALPSDMDGGLEEAATFRFPGLTAPNESDLVNVSGSYGFMCDVAVVEVDPRTGWIELVDYVSVHDAGRIIHPTIVKGQRWGAFLHGMAAALYETLDYDEDGQLLTGTLMDYLCPTAAEVPKLRMDSIESPSPFTPLGAKGCGDGSATPAPVAIANALADALRPLGIPLNQLPVTPGRLWETMREVVGR